MICTGAGHYAAANACLDAAALLRHQAGLPATAIQFGPFRDTGMAADYAAVLASMGIHSLQPSQVQPLCGLHKC